ncbi:MAG TPA: winged helix-turn-helix domain-containing protein [Burkholderiaceae bacterium]|jgi:DNA-binding winged helix-turn-helix (wHTH) protein/tetratricopeptide (TPR) repeat protein
MKKDPFQFGQWLVRPSTNCIEQAGETRQMEPRAMDVLLVLCAANGNVVSADQLLTECWGTGAYGDNPVHKTIAQLRRLLGDEASAPVYIETIRKRGYRTLAPLTFGSADTMGLPAWKDSSPFRGLQAFDRDHAQVFFGRTEATRQLIDAAHVQVEAGCALQLLLGPSGSGKTSVVLAGVFPALSLERSTNGLALLDATNFDLAEQGEQTLLVTLAGAMLDLEWSGQALFPGASAVSLAQWLKDDIGTVMQQMAAKLTMAAEQLAAEAAAQSNSVVNRRPRKLRFGIFIDRLEALFNVNRIGEAERRDFLQCLDRLARGDVVLLVLGCRNDFYPYIAAQPTLMEGKPRGAHFDLGPPSAAEIAQIIRMPAAMAGLTYGIDLSTQARLDDVLSASAVASPDALPLLQYCLQELYRLRSADGELSFSTFEELGGLEGAIGQRAEQVVTRFTEQQTASLARVMSLVVVLSANEESVTSRHAPWSALRNDEEREVVNALIESRLFVSDLMGDTPSFGVAHEALLRRWPRMAEWIEAHRAALRVRGGLAQQAARWVKEGRPDDLLLPQGKRLAEVKLLQQEGVFSLSEDETVLIAVSAKRAQWRGLLRTLAFTAIALLAVLATGMSIRATAAKRAAEQQRAEAEGLMGFMLGDFVDKLRPLGKLDLLDSVSLKGLEYLKRPQDRSQSDTELTQRAKALQVIGEVRHARGDPKGALDALTSAYDILQSQNKKLPQDTEVLKNLGATAFWIGQIYKDQSDVQKTEAYWRDYMRFSDRLNALEPDRVEWWIEQSYSHTNLGGIALTRGDLANAVSEFQQSIDLKERALSKTPNSTTLLGDLANTYSFMASAKASMGDLDAANHLYEKELQIVLHLRESAPAEVIWVRNQVFALRMRAAIRLAWGLDQQALSDYREAKKLFEDLLAHDPGNRNWQSGIATVRQEELRILARQRDAKDTTAQLMAIETSLQTLIASDPKNVDWALREAFNRMRIATANFARGKFDDARQENQLAIDSFRKLFAAGKTNVFIRRGMVESFLLSADIERSTKNSAGSMDACRKAYDVLESEAKASWDYRVLDPWVRVNYCLKNEQIADIAVKRLEKIGYNDLEYRRFISTTKERNER